MAIDKVKQYFNSLGIDNRIQEFDVSSATVELAAKALNCEPNHIAKSLTFMINETPVLIVVAGNMKIDNAKFKNEFHTKAKMLKPNEVEQLIGHQVGGVCPFAINENVQVYLDISLKEYQYVYPACGSSNSAIKLTVDELAKYSKFKRWIDVCKN